MSRLVEFGERKLGVPRPDVGAIVDDAYEHRWQWYLDVAKVTVTDLVSKGLGSLANRGSDVGRPVISAQNQIMEPREDA